MSSSNQATSRPGRGGKRKYAGRPAIHEGRTQAIHVTLPTSTIATLRRLGQGSVSRGIQVLVDKGNEPV